MLLVPILEAEDNVAERQCAKLLDKQRVSKCSSTIGEATGPDVVEPPIERHTDRWFLGMEDVDRRRLRLETIRLMYELLQLNRDDLRVAGHTVYVEGEALSQFPRFLN